MIFQTSFHVTRYGMIVDINNIRTRLVDEGGATEVSVQCAGSEGQSQWQPADKIDPSKVATSESIYDGFVVINMQVECVGDRIATALQELGHDGYPHTKLLSVSVA